MGHYDSYDESNKQQALFVGSRQRFIVLIVEIDSFATEWAESREPRNILFDIDNLEFTFTRGTEQGLNTFLRHVIFPMKGLYMPI